MRKLCHDRGNGTGLNCVTWRKKRSTFVIDGMFETLKQIICFKCCFVDVCVSKTIFYGLLVFLFKVLWMLAAARLFTVLILHHFAKHTFSCST